MSVIDTPTLTALLGPRAAVIMQRFWTHGPATVRDIHSWLTCDEPRTYTTTLTICTRLWEKGMLDRQPDGRAYRYAPRLSEAEFLRTAITTTPEPPEPQLAAIPHQSAQGSERETIELLLVYLCRLRDERGQTVDPQLLAPLAALLVRAESAERAVQIYQAEALRALQRAAAAERRAEIAEQTATGTPRRRAPQIPVAAVYEFPGRDKVCRVCGRPAPPPSTARHDDLRVCALESCRQEARRRDNAAKQRRYGARQRAARRAVTAT